MQLPWSRIRDRKAEAWLRPRKKTKKINHTLILSQPLVIHATYKKNPHSVGKNHFKKLSFKIYILKVLIFITVWSFDNFESKINILVAFLHCESPWRWALPPNTKSTDYPPLHNYLSLSLQIHIEQIIQSCRKIYGNYTWNNLVQSIWIFGLDSMGLALPNLFLESDKKDSVINIWMLESSSAKE